MTKKTLRGAAAITVLAPCLAAWAQQPSPSSVVPRASDLAPPLAAPSRDPGALPVPPQPVAKELGKPEDDIVVDVTGYVLDDDAPAPLKAALKELTAPFVGPQRSYEDLQNAAAAVARFMQRELDYYLGHAFLPAQKVQGGVIRISILEGRLDETRLNWRDDLPVDRALVEARLAQLKPGAILTASQMERVILLLNDLRGVYFRAEVQPGRRPGTATLVFTPRPDAAVSVRLDVDANGSRYIGTERLGTLLMINSPTGAGDGLSASALASTSGGLKFALLSYVRPLVTGGIKIGASVSKTHYQLDRRDFPLDYRGDSIAFTGFGLYPWVRSRNLNTFVVLSTDDKSYLDTVANIGTRKKVNSVTLGLTGDWRDTFLGGGVSTYDFNLSGGRIRYPQGRPDGLDDAEHFAKTTLSLSRLQALPVDRLMVYGALRGQWAFRNLDSTEQFRAGGPESVRAYAAGEGTGDSGLIATAELRWLPPETLFGSAARDFVFGAFVDTAFVRLRRDPSLILRPDSYDNTRSYGGVGLYGGWQWNERARANISLAWPVHGKAVNDTVERRPRVYFQGSWTQ